MGMLELPPTISTRITTTSPGGFQSAWMNEADLLNPGKPTIVNSLSAQYLTPPSAYPAPASTPSAAAAGSGQLSPITLVAPMPSITPPNPATTGQNKVTSQQVSGAGGFLCQVSNWAENNKGLAVLAAFGLYFALRGGKR